MEIVITTKYSIGQKVFLLKKNIFDYYKDKQIKDCIICTKIADIKTIHFDINKKPILSYAVESPSIFWTVKEEEIFVTWDNAYENAIKILKQYCTQQITHMEKINFNEKLCKIMAEHKEQIIDYEQYKKDILLQINRYKEILEIF